MKIKSKKKLCVQIFCFILAALMILSVAYMTISLFFQAI